MLGGRRRRLRGGLLSVGIGILLGFERPCRGRRSYTREPSSSLLTYSTGRYGRCLPISSANRHDQCRVLAADIVWPARGAARVAIERAVSRCQRRGRHFPVLLKPGHNVTGGRIDIVWLNGSRTGQQWVLAKRPTMPMQPSAEPAGANHVRPDRHGRSAAPSARHRLGKRSAARWAIRSQ
jgi:hypothetical protein